MADGAGTRTSNRKPVGLGADDSLWAILGSLIIPLYLPWVGLAVGLGMISVVLPLAMTDAELSYGAIAAVLAASGVGSAVSAVPAGARVARVGERPMMLVGLVALAVSMALLATTTRPALMAALQFASGSGAVGLRVAGQTLVTHLVADAQRGRALSMMGGIRRFGAFVGPVLGGFAIQTVGFTWAFVAAGALPLLGVVPLLTGSAQRLQAEVARPAPISLRHALGRHWKRLVVLASGPVLIMSVRRGRALVLPLIADDLGIEPVVVGLVVAIGTGADLLLFPLAGYIMDTYGRLRAIIPAFGLMGVGLITLGLVDGATGVVVAGVIIGLGNGLSAGSMLTLGSDLAPPESPSQFMAAFAALQDWGIVIGPLLVGMVASTLGLAQSAIVLGLMIWVGVTLIANTAGETNRAVAG